jgi:hypothetical protein
MAAGEIHREVKRLAKIKVNFSCYPNRGSGKEVASIYHSVKLCLRFLRSSAYEMDLKLENLRASAEE